MTNSMSPEEIAEMSEDHQCSCKELEQLRADISEAYYLRDKAEGRFCTALGTIEQLHAAVKTAQELAATRLMEIERLQSNEREHIQEITELTQNRDDYKADYLRMHKMFMDLKYPDTVPAHEPLEQHVHVGNVIGKDAEGDVLVDWDSEEHTPEPGTILFVRLWTQAELDEADKYADERMARLAATAQGGASRDASGYHCLDCGADLSNHPTAASAHRCSPSRT